MGNPFKSVTSFLTAPFAPLQKQPKAPNVPKEPEREDKRVQEARRKALEQEAQARGRRSTLLTGGRGVTAPGLVEQARLLGGTG